MEIQPRQLLNGLLHECLVCSEYFFENAALVLDLESGFSDEQIEKLFIVMADFHREH